MAITVGTSTVTSGNQTTGFTLVINSGVVAGDILILLVTNRGATTDPVVVDNDVGGNLWAKIANQNADTNGAGTVWWKRATSATASKTITVTGCTNSASGCVTPFTGAAVGSTPYGTPVSEANASGNEVQAGITTGRDGSMVCIGVYCTSNDTLNPNTYVATDPSSLTERAEGVSSGGSDCSASLAADIRTSAGATGNISWSQGDGTGASIAFELLRAWEPLAANGGSISLSGTAASLEAGRLVAAGTGAYTETGTDASLEVGRMLSADGGADALTGTAASLEIGYLLSAGSGGYTLTGQDADLIHDTAGYTMPADPGAFSWTGGDSGLRVARRLDSESGSFSESGQDSSLEYGREVQADAGAFAIAGSDAALIVGRAFAADAGAFAIAGSDAALEYGYLLAAGSGEYVLFGDAVTFVAPVPPLHAMFFVSDRDGYLRVVAMLQDTAADMRVIPAAVWCALVSFNQRTGKVECLQDEDAGGWGEWNNESPVQTFDLEADLEMSADGSIFEKQFCKHDDWDERTVAVRVTAEYAGGNYEAVQAGMLVEDRRDAGARRRR
jgi:hypothetical protein